MGVEEAGARAPEIVMKAADDFCWRQHWMMLVGDVKGAILDDAVRERVGTYSAAPDGEFAAIEFGTYVGYSAVRIARLIPRAGRLYSVDPNPEVQGIARELVALAGLRERVHFIPRTAQAATEELARAGQKFDMVFIDHDKRDYLASLLRLEQAGMLKPGCTVVADNVEVFKLQDYLTHVRTCGRYRSRNFQSSLEYTPPLEYQPVDADGRPLGTHIADAVEVSVYAPP